MSRVIKSLRNLELGGRLDFTSKSASKLEDEQQQQQEEGVSSSAAVGHEGTKSGGLLSRLKPGKQKSYESLLDAGSPTEERPIQQQQQQQQLHHSQSGWATFDDCANLIDLSSPLPAQQQQQQQVKPTFFIDTTALQQPPPPQPQMPLIIRSTNGKGGKQVHSGSLECLSVQTAGAQAQFNPSFRKESPKSKAAPAPPPSSAPGHSSSAGSGGAAAARLRHTPPPRPSQPPPRPSQPPKVIASASSNALLLLDLDFGQPQIQQQQQSAKSRKAPAPPPPVQARSVKQPQPAQQPQPAAEFHLSPGLVCSAKFELASPPDPGILSLRPGDRLQIVRREDDNWMVARRLSGDYREGLVACSYLAPVENLPESPPTPASVLAPTAPSPIEADASATRARSLHDYRSDHPGDLSFSAGQLIVRVRRVDSDWLEGQLPDGGPRGLFPANHAQLLLYTAVARHAFPAQQAGDLALEVGDQVDVLAELPGGEWLRGRRRSKKLDDDAGEVGTFPAAFVAPAEADAESNSAEAQAQAEAAAAPQERRARALYDFVGREADELTFQAGDLLTGVTELGPDWLAGVATADGRRGIFPRAFVEML